MTEQPTPLTPLAEDWDRALCIVAHPDDMEFGSAAAVARWTAHGKDIAYCLVTSGEAGIDGIQPSVSGPLREAEQVESCRVVGVTEIDFLRHPDGILEYGLPLRRALAEVIRRRQPEIVITMNFHEAFGGGNLNQADHIVVGRATLDAVRDAGNRWIFHEQIEAGLAPWGGVREVWAGSSPEASHGVDTTDTFELGVESLRAHKAYIDGLGWEGWDPAEFLEGIARPTGTRLGTKFAAAFEVFSMGWNS